MLYKCILCNLILLCIENTEKRNFEKKNQCANKDMRFFFFFLKIFLMKERNEMRF